MTAAKNPSPLARRAPDPSSPPPSPSPPRPWHQGLAEAVVQSLKRGARTTVADAAGKAAEFLRTDPIGRAIGEELSHADRMAAIAAGMPQGPGPLRIAVAKAARDLHEKLKD